MASWIISPVFSLVIGYLMFKTIVRLVLSKQDTFQRALKLSPFFIGIAVFIVVLSFLFKTPLGKELAIGMPVAVIISLSLASALGWLGKILLQWFVKNDTANGAESVFRRIQIGTSCYVALAQGANDVANAIGPLAVIYFLVKTGSVGAQGAGTRVSPFFRRRRHCTAASAWPATGSWTPSAGRLQH